MANTLFDSARKGFLEGRFNWNNDSGETYKCILVDTNIYTPNIQLHTTLADVTNAAIFSQHLPLVGRTTAGGAADAEDITFQSVPAGTTYEALILYRDQGASNASELLAIIDTATGLPITANGGDIIVVWDNGTNKIFRV
jgi:hypothetical protein